LKRNKNSFETINDFRDKYGPIYTVWLGPSPMVVINDLEYAKEAFAVRNSDIAGRVMLNMRKKKLSQIFHLNLFVLIIN
jgi:hypothetical protein